jgi:GNAT superfamily N-acetyltransferase
LPAVVGDQQGARGVGGGLDQTDVEFAVDIALDHIGDADGGQGAGLGEALLAALAQFALGLQLADHLAQGAALGALQAEVAGEIGFLGRSRLAQEGAAGFVCREGRRSRDRTGGGEV